MATTNLDAYNLSQVSHGGQIHEDLMNAVYDISAEDRPFCDAVGSTTSGNDRKEWVREQLAAAAADNARIDGEDSTSNDARSGERLANYHQIMTKTVKVSDRGRESDTVGTSDELIRQLMKRQKELRRDEEAAMTGRNVALQGTDVAAGTMAGVGSWIGVSTMDNAVVTASTTSARGASSTDPTLSGTIAGGGFPDTAAVTAASQALSEADIKDMMKAAYVNGGNPTMALSVPAAIELLSDYLFTASARVATLQSNAPQGNRTTASSGNGNSGGGIVAQGSVNVLVTNFGTLELVPDRFMPHSGTDEADLYLIDPDLWERSYLQGYETNELARTGLAENREISVDATLVALNPEGNAVVADIDLTTPAVA